MEGDVVCEALRVPPLDDDCVEVAVTELVRDCVCERVDVIVIEGVCVIDLDCVCVGRTYGTAATPPAKWSHACGFVVLIHAYGGTTLSVRAFAAAAVPPPQMPIPVTPM